MFDSPIKRRFQIETNEESCKTSTNNHLQLQPSFSIDSSFSFYNSSSGILIQDFLLFAHRLTDWLPFHPSFLPGSFFIPSSQIALVASLLFPIVDIKLAGFNGTLCRLIPDPSDPECCKIAICETALTRDVSLVLDSAEAINSSTVRIKIVMEPSILMQNDSNISSSYPLSIHVKPHIDLFLSRIDEEMHYLDHGEESKVEWIRRAVGERSMRQVGSNAFDFEVSSLEPATEYLMKIKRRIDNTTSNTVLVRTFPPGIDSSFTGCFHGNKTYDVGQIFFDGCAYKCTCREGGIRECEERCPVYIDTVGYENCIWIPAPNDPCCTIPVCDRNQTIKIGVIDNDASKTMTSTTALPKIAVVSSPEQPFCTNGEELFALGQSWQDSSSCNKKSCACLIHANGTTFIQCTGGCPEVPDAALKPSMECPLPSLVTPDDRCLCPYVICHKERNGE